VASGEAAVRQVAPDELDPAARVLAQAFLHNPLERAAFHQNDTVRERQLRTLFGGLVAVPSIGVVGAYVSGELVGVAALTPFGQCSPKTSEVRLLVGPMTRLGPVSLARFGYWMARWHLAAPARPHRHLQLLGVKPPLQGRGIGSLLLRWYCTGLDDRGEFAYHETDKPENLVFYGRRGFELAGETTVFGVKTWRLSREPRPMASVSTDP
jgi:GNAT superfamily N-acetyltransferase